MRVLIVGCGYVGLPLGAELVRQGHEVWGLRRTLAAQEELESAGIVPAAADITKPETLEVLPAGFDWVVHCVSSSHGGAEAYRQVYLDGTRNLLNWLGSSPPKKLVYTSSTSVYGQGDGSLVHETSPAEPVTETARVLVETERMLLDDVDQCPAVILRVAGIYGPARGYWFQQYVKGEAKMDGRGERILNMLHRDDVVGAILAALEHGRPGEVYNAVDDEPVSQLVLFQWLADKLGRDLPPPAPAGVVASRKRGLTSKRVSNRKLKQQLGYHFKYPTFREGFAAC
ncbi:MAG TPA: SDR family oxidoreductase [Candidatus Binatia bacterium]|jgi:nucleoside-diphosphate-sugar epimerase|nr:SDR family oxidoreductase [Candidatus Binatia bacterium]